MRQILVVPVAVFPGTAAAAVEGFSDPGCVGERASVQRHAKHDLVGWDAIRDVVFDARVGVEGRRVGVVLALVEVGLVAGIIGETGPGVVEGHQVPEVEVLVHVFPVVVVVVFGAWFGLITPVGSRRGIEHTG